MKELKTLNEALKACAQAGQRGITFIEGINNESTVSYEALHQRALQQLHYFQQQGLQAGDELILFLKNNEKFVDTFWACILGGIIPVPVAVGISDEHRSKLLRIYKRLNRPYLLIDQKSAELLQAYTNNQASTEYDNMTARMILLEDITLSDAVGQEHTPQADDLAFIQFSSGSTRDPKGVCLTHKNIIATVNGMGNHSRYTSDDISLSWMPLTHDMGIIGFHLNMVVFDMHQCIMATDVFSRRPLLWMQKAHEKRASILSSPNFGFKHYLKMHDSKDAHQLDLSCVRIIICGAEPISVDLSRQFIETLGAYGLNPGAVCMGYGLAEGTLGVAMAAIEQPFEYITVERDSLIIDQAVNYVDDTHPQAVRFPLEGYAIEGCQMRIANLDGIPLANGMVGEIQIKGDTVTQGYYNDSESNAGLFTQDQWLRTGDLGLLHEGKLAITGRLKDIIFVHGQNFYPHDLEGIILNTSEFELGKVVVAGVRKDDADHDDILACVLYRAELNDFIPHVKNIKLLINEQTGLEVTHVLPVTRIPKTTSGKVQRRFFAEAYIKGEYDSLIQDIEGLIAAPATSNNATDGLSEYAHKIKFVCDSLLPEKAIGVEDNFFEIGLSSLDLAQIHEKIDEFYPEVLDITDIFDHPTINALALFIQDKVAT